MALNFYSEFGPNQATAPNANYPYGSAKNIPFLGSSDGTPFVKKYVDDILGFLQKLLDQGGVTPSTAPDTVLASDYYNALRLSSGYPGLIAPYVLNVTPASLGLRILLLDGSGILVANYPELTDAVYCGDPSNPAADAFYRADYDDGTSRNTAGAYLILADARGRFMRGIDPAGTLDPEADRLAGDEQDWAINQHGHTLTNAAGDIYDASSFTSGSIDGIRTIASGPPSEAHFASGVATSVGGTFPSDNLDVTELRPVNMAVNWGIWY